MNGLTDMRVDGLTEGLLMNVFWDYGTFFWITLCGWKVRRVSSDNAMYFERG